MTSTTPKPEPIRELRGFDRTNDHRIICSGCKRDFGGTVAPLPGYKIKEIICPRCTYGTFANYLAEISNERQHQSAA